MRATAARLAIRANQMDGSSSPLATSGPGTGDGPGADMAAGGTESGTTGADANEARVRVLTAPDGVRPARAVVAAARSTPAKATAPTETTSRAAPHDQW